MSGRYIFGHVSITSGVANSNAITNPSSITNCSRASRIVLRDLSEQRISIVVGTYKPPSSYVSSFFWQPAATRAGSEPSCKYLFPSVTGNAYRCESIQYVIRDPLAIRRTTKASRPASGPPSLKLEGWPGYAVYRSQCARTQILSPKKDSITGITRWKRLNRCP
jgi:hypothetical protein